MTASETHPASAPGPDGFPAREGIPVDRCAAERAHPGLVDELRAHPTTLVLVVRGDTAPLVGDQLNLVAPSEVPDDAHWAFLGRDAQDRGVLLAAFPADREPEPVPSPGGWGMLRAVGATLPAAETGALATGVALGRWLLDSRFCPACGSATQLSDAGWSRRCPSCGRQHFPRTDPAVIVAVTSADDPDVLLLGSNALWDAERYSCFAGFAEVGESLEDAVLREVQEEAGVRVDSLRYRGSQGWPYPRSLMVGFEAQAAPAAEAVPDGEEILSVRWFHRDEIRDALAGAGPVKLPGPASIAHRLISAWLEGAE